MTNDLAQALQQLLAAPQNIDRTTLLALGQQLTRLGAQQPKLVFATPPYLEFARQVVAASNGWLELGAEERKTHKDGKGWHRYVTPLDGREVVVIGGTQTDSDQMELYRMCYNAWYWDARKLTILIPYHGDARQERYTFEGESVDGLYASAMFTSIPKTPDGNSVFLVDIHSDTITGYFSGGGMRCKNIDVLPHLIKQVAEERFAGDCVVVAPDAGRYKVVYKTAKALNLASAVTSKNRTQGEVETQGLLGDVQGRNVIVSDDMGVSLESASGSGRFLDAHGAAERVLVVTHGVIPVDRSCGRSYLEAFIEAGQYSCLYTTDSLPHVYELQARFPSFLKVIPLAPLVVSHLIG
jgi:ribose-phosphate pyrophosphokinase